MATMMELCEDIERLVGSGISTENAKWERRYTMEKLNQGRAVIARNDYKVNHSWNSSLLQTFYPEFEQYFQNSACVTRFRIPTGFISVDYSTTGLIYAGSSDGATNNTYLAQNFLKINNRTELNDLINHPRMTPTNGIYTGILFEGLTVTIYGLNTVKNLMVSGVFDQPDLLPDFSPAKDKYPLDESLFPLVQTYIYQQAFGIEAATPLDNLPNSTGGQVQSFSNMVNKRLAK